VDRRELAPQSWEDVVLYPDPHQETDRDLNRTPGVWEQARRHEEILNANCCHFEHAVLMAWKPENG